jgi:hypothetical protein
LGSLSRDVLDWVMMGRLKTGPAMLTEVSTTVEVLTERWVVPEQDLAVILMQTQVVRHAMGVGVGCRAQAAWLRRCSLQLLRQNTVPWYSVVLAEVVQP